LELEQRNGDTTDKIFAHFEILKICFLRKLVIRKIFRQKVAKYDLFHTVSENKLFYPLHVMSISRIEIQIRNFFTSI